MSCDCFEKVNMTLAKDNEQLFALLNATTGKVLDRAFVTTEKLDPKKRTKVRRMMASFCPFCGTAYEKPAAANGVSVTKKVSSKKT